MLVLGEEGSGEGSARVFEGCLWIAGTFCL